MSSISKHKFHRLRFAERFGSSHGVSNVFRPNKRPLDPDMLLTDDNLRSDERVIWFGAAAFFAMTALVPLIGILIPDFPGITVPPELRDTGQLITGVAGITFAAVWLICGLRNVPTMFWLHPIIGLGTLLIAISMFDDIAYAPDVVGFLIMPAIAATFFLPVRQAIPHVAIIAGLIIYVAAANTDLPYAGAELGLMMIFLISTSAMMAMARDRIQRGIAYNVDLAGKDPLTGVANLRQLRERINFEVKRADRREQPLTILMIDLDDFSRVNDEFSHTLGDAVLVACAQAMQRVVRGSELLARRSSDEFAVITVGETEEELNALTERLRAAVRKERERLCPDVTPEFTVGQATWREGENGEALLRRADRSLHVARSLGYGFMR
ncbi:MAG: GGDEF domain-containing protein [Thermoleophilaceae bacterium]|nr:GGDEF domain-containing protein [Thermoleophilaceae bacterium]